MKSTSHFLPRLLSILAALFLSSSLHAAVITVGDTLDGEIIEDWTDVPFTFTTDESISAGAAANSILLVAVGSTDNDLLSVSYGGQALTKAVTSGSGAVFRESSIWYLANPGSFAASSQLSISTNSHSNTGNNVLFTSAAVFSNVDLTNPFLDTAAEADNVTRDGVALSYDLGASPVDTVYFESIYYNAGFANDLIGTDLFKDGIRSDFPEEASRIQGYTFADDVSGTVIRNFGLTGTANNLSGAGVALAVIPEPSAFALLMGAASFLLLLRRRRS